MARIDWRDMVKKNHDAMLRANSATPYMHDPYERAENAMRLAAAQYWTDPLVCEEGIARIFDCGEIHSPDRIVADLMDRMKTELREAVENLAWAVEEDYVTSCQATIADLIGKIADFSPAWNPQKDMQKWAMEALAGKHGHRHVYVAPAGKIGGVMQCWCGDRKNDDPNIPW